MFEKIMKTKITLANFCLLFAITAEAQNNARSIGNTFGKILFAVVVVMLVYRFLVKPVMKKK